MSTSASAKLQATSREWYRNNFMNRREIGPVSACLETVRDWMEIWLYYHNIKLEVSRGFGDFQYKGDEALKPEQQKVSSTPEVYQLYDFIIGVIIL